MTDEVAAAESPPEISSDVLVEKYVALRDKKAEIESAHKLHIAKFNSAMERIENILLKRLNDSNSESVRTKAGTFFKHTKTSATVADWDGLRDWVLQEPDERFAALEKRVSKSFVESYQAEHNDLPPGVDVRSEVTVQIRRS